jgi:glycosyltransferase involved in cell wall biosynthesis
MADLESIRDRRGAIGSALRHRYGIAVDAPLMVTLSGNQKGKGLHLLAQAWPEILRAVPGARWLLCGPDHPWLAAAVRPLLQRQAVENTVCFSGVLSGQAVYEHLAAGDVHVNPTLCEGLNMVTVEAAAVGTPTITSDGAGIADWVERLQAGLVVPAGDVQRWRGRYRRTAIAWLAFDMAGTNPHSSGRFSLERIAANAGAAAIL